MFLKQFLKTNKFRFQGILKIFRNLSWLVVSGVFFRGSLVLVEIISARKLGVSKYGEFAFTLSFAMIFKTIVDFGLSGYTVQVLSQSLSKANDYINSIFWVKLLIGVLSLVVIYLISNVLGVSQHAQLLIVILSVYMVINNQSQFLFSIFRAYEDMKLEAIPKIIQSIVLILSVLMVLSISNRVVDLASVYIVVALIGFGVTLSMMFLKTQLNVRIKINKKLIKKTIKNSIPFVLSAFFIEMYYYVDSIILGLYKTDSIVGFYKSAYNLIIVFTFILTAVSGVFIPRMSRWFINKKQFFNSFVKQSAKSMLIVTIPIFYCIFLFSSQIIMLVLGSEYSLTIDAFKILIWSVFIICNYFVFSLALTASGNQKIIMQASIAGAIFNVIANVIFVPHYSLYASAVITVLTEVLVSMLIIRSTMRILITRVPWKYLSKVVTISVTMIVVSSLFAKIHLFLAIGGIAIYVLFVVVYDTVGLKSSILQMVKKD